MARRTSQRLRQESSWLVAGRPSRSLVLPRDCEHVAAFSRLRRVSRSGPRFIGDASGRQAIPLALRVAVLEALGISGSARHVRDGSSRFCTVLLPDAFSCRILFRVLCERGFASPVCDLPVAAGRKNH